jgi:glutamate 5-kinase
MSKSIRMVVKIGSMALIRTEESDIDYNILSRLSRELAPGDILISSGATEIGRLDYLKRTGAVLKGDPNEVKTDYAAQGQAILMSHYRQFIRPEYSVRQVLVEHTHFNQPEKRAHIASLLLRAVEQGAIPIINYNDPVSDEENRKMELSTLRKKTETVVELVDNDETAAVIADLVGAKILVILTSTEGIYRDAADPSTLVHEVTGRTPDQIEANIRRLQESCVGASREGAQGAKAKLEYMILPARRGTQIIIAHSRHRIADLIAGIVPCTRIGLTDSTGENISRSLSV